MPIVKVLMPGFACVTVPGVEGSPDSVQEAVDAGYSRVYILQGQDILLHQQLPAGKDGKLRFVRMKVPGLPGNHKLRTIAPGMDPLPAGKIPVELLLTIQKFFKDVMRHFQTKLEAMIWILWSAEKGYYLHVPTQQVGAASARYDWDSLPADSEIVVDIHSHADMGAFFSGTDDNDDRIGVRYSGVIGRNSLPDPEMKFRFNFMGSRVDVPLGDLFSFPRPQTEDPPAEWLQKVTEVGYRAPGAPAGYTYASTGLGWVKPTGGRGPQGSLFPPERGAPRNLDGSPRHTRRLAALGDDEDDLEVVGGSAGFGLVGSRSKLTQALETGEKADGLRRVPGPKAPSLPAEEGIRIVEVHGARLVQIGEEVIPYEDWQRSQQVRQEEQMESEIQAFLARRRTEGMEDAIAAFCAEEVEGNGEALETREEAMARLGRMEREELLSGAPQEQASPEAQVLAGLPEDLSEDPRFDTMAINFGVATATAFVIIDEASAALANSGEPLNRTVETLFDMVDDSDKAEVLRLLYHRLSSRDQSDIATSGF